MSMDTTKEISNWVAEDVPSMAVRKSLECSESLYPNSKPLSRKEFTDVIKRHLESISKAGTLGSDFTKILNDNLTELYGS